MALTGHIAKEIHRKVRQCIIDDGLKPSQCVERMDEQYELNSEDRKEILEMAKGVGKIK